MSSLPRCLIGVCVALFACGGGSGGSPPPDAPPDAPAAVTGIGQACVPAMDGADCPAQAMGCLQYSANATIGICTPLCVESGTMTVDATGNLTVTPDPLGAGPSGICSTAYTAGIGESACTAVVGWSPADDPLVAGKTYSGVAVACEIYCSADNKCPGALTCNMGRCET